MMLQHLKTNWAMDLQLTTSRRSALALLLLVYCVAEATSASDVVVEVSANQAPAPAGNPPVMGESALIDKETGRIFWEGGSTSTLSASLAPLLEELGIRHVRATLLTCILLLAIISNTLFAWMRGRLEETTWRREGTESWLLKSLLLLIDWTVLRIPRFDARVVVAVYLVYLLEAYTCSTRRYLANAIASPVELEQYIERLRKEPPLVTWKVRCFHYEPRKWLTLLLLAKVWKLLWKHIGHDEEDVLYPSTGSQSSFWTKKVVTHQAFADYKYTSFHDSTVASVWKRARATNVTPAPFTKIVLSKLLLLSTAKARDDYFKQQSSFVTKQGQADEYAEFSTSIQVHGFKRHMLAIRPVQGHPSAKLFRLHSFWIFTFLGLTVPFRIWFSRHCDELRVTVTKETTSEKSYLSSWFASRSSGSQAQESQKEDFNRLMRSLSLYARTDAEHSETEEKEEEILVRDVEAATAAAMELTKALNETQPVEEASPVDLVDTSETVEQISNASAIEINDQETEDGLGDETGNRTKSND